MASDSAVHSLAGAAGGILAMTVTYPLIFLSTRSAVDVKKTNKVFNVCPFEKDTSEELTEYPASYQRHCRARGLDRAI